MHSSTPQPYNNNHLADVFVVVVVVIFPIQMCFFLLSFERHWNRVTNGSIWYFYLTIFSWVRQKKLHLNIRATCGRFFWKFICKNSYYANNWYQSGIPLSNPCSIGFNWCRYKQKSRMFWTIFHLSIDDDELYHDGISLIYAQKTIAGFSAVVLTSKR